MRVTMSNIVKIGPMFAEILQFYAFSKVAAAAILDFKKFLPADTLERPNLRKHAKFHQDRPIRC